MKKSPNAPAPFLVHRAPSSPAAAKAFSPTRTVQAKPAASAFRAPPTPPAFNTRPARALYRAPIQAKQALRPTPLAPPFAQPKLPVAVQVRRAAPVAAIAANQRWRPPVQQALVVQPAFIGRWASSAYNGVTTAGSNLYNSVSNRVTGVTTGIATGAAAVRTRVGNAVTTATTGIGNGVAATRVRINNGIAATRTGLHNASVTANAYAITAAHYVPAGKDWVKEYLDPRRSTYNPYWQSAHQDTLAYEGLYSAVGYHSSEKHGGHHSMDDIRGRLIPNAAVGNNRSFMPSTGGGFVGRSTESSRFATDAWHNYTRNKAKAHFMAIVPPTGGHAIWSWPNGLVAPSAWNIAHTFVSYPNHVSFYITYTDNLVGFIVTGAHQHGQSASCTYTLIGYDNAGNAYINQHYPTGAAGLAEQRIGAAPAVPLVGGNIVVPYNAVPWLSQD